MALSGCSMVSTELLDSTDTIREGSVAYALPMTLLKLVVFHYPESDAYDIAPFEGFDCTSSADIICSQVLKVPDPNHRYLVRYEGSILSDDELTLSVGPDGYISNIKAKAIDRTGDILVAVSEIATGAYKKQTSLSDRHQGEPELETTILVDPNSSHSLALANRQLSHYDLSIACAGACGEPAAPVAGERDEVFFRHEASILIRIADRSGSKTLAAYPLKSFNGSPLIGRRFERGPFITRETEVTANEDGTVEVRYDKASEALGAVTIAGTVVGNIIAAPVNVFTQQTADLNARETNLKARESLLNERQKFLEAEKAAAGSPGSLSNREQTANIQDKQKTSAVPTESDIISAGSAIPPASSDAPKAPEGAAEGAGTPLPASNTTGRTTP